jgi:hypothetical protein
MVFAKVFTEAAVELVGTLEVSVMSAEEKDQVPDARKSPEANTPPKSMVRTVGVAG